MTESVLGHVHVGGGSRSGTTLLLELMRSCYDWEWAPNEEVKLRALLKQHPGRCLTKRPASVDLIRAVLHRPDSSVLYCIRDPRDIICSRHKKVPDRYWTTLWAWRRQRQAFEAIRRHPRIITIRYEDLVTDPDQVQHVIEHHVGWLARKARFSDFHKVSRPSEQSLTAMHGLRPVDTSSIGRWRGHLPRLAGQIKQHGDITPELIADGYETDDSWREVLDGIEPDLSPSVFEPRNYFKLGLRYRIKTALALFLISLRYRLGGN